jgi:hypothetical protein
MMKLNSAEIHKLSEKLNSEHVQENLSKVLTDLLNSPVEGKMNLPDLLNSFNLKDNLEVKIEFRVPVNGTFVGSEKNPIVVMAYKQCYVCGVFVPGPCPKDCPHPSD